MAGTKIVDLLTTLFYINTNRIERYNTAKRVTEEPDLKDLFCGFIQTSKDFNEALTHEAHTLGEELPEENGTTGMLSKRRRLVSVKPLTADRNAMINFCGKEEFSALESYRLNLRNNLDHITSDQHALITRQYDLLSRDLDKAISIQQIAQKVV